MLLQHLLLWLIIFNSTVEVHASSEAVQEFWDSFAPLILPQSAHVGYAAFMHSFSLLYVDAHTILSGIIVSSKVPYWLKQQSVHEDLQLLAHGLVHVHSSIKLWQLWTSHIPYFRQFPWLKNVDGCFSSSPQIGKSYQHLYWWLLYFWYFCCLTWTGVKTAESLTAYVVVTTWVVLWVIPLQSIVSPLQIRRRILGKKRGRLSCWGLQLKLDHPDVFFMHIICTTSFPCLWTLHGVSTLNITVYWFCFIPPSVNSSHN